MLNFISYSQLSLPLAGLLLFLVSCASSSPSDQPESSSAPPAERAAFENITWRLDSFTLGGSKKKTDISDDIKPVLLSFEENNVISFQLPCNNYRVASFKITPQNSQRGSLGGSTITGTKMACPPGLPQTIEENSIEILANPLEYYYNHQRKILVLEGPRGSLTFSVSS